MKTGQLIILFVFCIIIGAAGFFVWKNKQHSWDKKESRTGEKFYDNLPLNDVQKMTITTKDSNVELEKKDDSWVVVTGNSYYADFSKIADFLKKVAEVTIVQEIEIAENDFGRLELNSPDKDNGTGTNIEFFDKNDSLLGKMVLGKNHMRKSQGKPSPYGGGGEYPDGRYIHNPKSKIIALVSETFSSISENNDSWIDKTFFKVDKIKKAFVKEGDKILWTVQREDENDSLELEGELKADEKVNKSKLNGIDSALRYPSFNKVADPAVTDDVHGFTGDSRRFVAETFEGLTYTVVLGTKTEDDEYPIKIEIDYKEPELAPGPDEETAEEKTNRELDHQNKLVEGKKKFDQESSRYTQWVYLVSSYTVDDMILNRSDLIEIKEESEGEAEFPGPIPPMLNDSSTSFETDSESVDSISIDDAIPFLNDQIVNPPDHDSFEDNGEPPNIIQLPDTNTIPMENGGTDKEVEKEEK